jgi:hypothetical protein
VFERLELVAIGKLPVKQQADNLLERRVGSEIVNIVSTIGEAPDGAFDITQLGRPDDDAFETPIYNR